MKKGVLVSLFLLLFIIGTVSADMVWTPMDEWFEDMFWNPDPNGNRACEYISRDTYIANGANGEVRAMKTPISDEVTAVYPNGTEFKIQWKCEAGGKEWGALYAVWSDAEKDFVSGENDRGYILFEDLQKAYDNTAFLEEHQNEFQTFDQADFDLKNSDGFILWEFPGSNKSTKIDKESIEPLIYNAENFQESNLENPPFRQEYTWIDPNGGKWVSMTLFFDHLCGWIYTDDPHNDQSISVEKTNEYPVPELFNVPTDEPFTLNGKPMVY